VAGVPSEDIAAQLLVTFVVEAQEHLRAMNRHLLALERGTEGEARESLLAEVFREAHSLKGAARAVNLVEVEARAHELEDVFARMKDGEVDPRADVLDDVYRTLDAIEESVQQVTGAHTGGVREAASGGEMVRRAKVSIPPPRLEEDTVRVATAKLDALMAEVGELLVARIGAEQRLAEINALEAALADWESAWKKLPPVPGPAREDGATRFQNEGEVRLGAALKAVGELRRTFQADTRRMAQITADLQGDVRRARMFPVATVFEAFPRMVRDLARDQGREVSLSSRGGEIEVDRSVLEQLKDPLTHLLRNCVDHGIEPPEARVAAGKPREGAISLSARQRGDMLVVEVADDGIGIDPERVRTSAVKKGLLAGDVAGELSEREVISLIFRSGLSTSPIITDVSGRGVGLDVVREVVERLHGSIDVRSERGRGTTFSFSLPLSVSTMQCLVLEAGGQTFALPLTSVERLVRLRPASIERAEGRDVVRLDDGPVVLTRLTDLLGIETPANGAEKAAGRPAIVLGGSSRRAAVLVDRLVRTQESLVKSLPEPLFRVRHVAGATVLGTGEAAIILSAADLLASVERVRAPALAIGETPEVGPATILIVEDSITTRTLEKNILEAAGYQVLTSADGGEAWSLLASDGCDLVVADIEMPGMDGFELTAKLRADKRFRDLPVVLVTARDSREDRERGIQVGADAYIVKGAFDQDRLLDTIRRLI